MSLLHLWLRVAAPSRPPTIAPNFALFATQQTTGLFTEISAKTGDFLNSAQAVISSKVPRSQYRGTCRPRRFESRRLALVISLRTWIAGNPPVRIRSPRFSPKISFRRRPQHTDKRKIVKFRKPFGVFRRASRYSSTRAISSGCNILGSPTMNRPKPVFVVPVRVYSLLKF